MKKIISVLSIGLAGLTLSAGYVSAENAVVTTAAPTVSAIPVADIESDILSIQKDIVSIVREGVNYYSKGDIKETGDMKFNFAYSSTGTSAKVGVNVEKYANILSVMTGNQEMHFVFTANLEAKDENHTKYDATTDKVTTTTENIVATVKADVGFKIIGEDLFVTLTSLSKDRTGTDDFTKSFDKVFKELPLQPGQTLRVNIGKHNTLNQAEVLKKVNAVLDVLDANTLFTPKSKKGESYALGIKRATAQKINMAIGENKNAGLATLNNGKNSIMYTKVGTTTTLSIDDRRGYEKNRVALVRTAGNYEFQFDNKGSGYSKDSSATIRVSKDKASARIKNKNSTFDLDWNNNTLAVTSKWKEYSWDDSGKDTWNTITVNGALSLSGADLKATYNGREVGHAKITSAKDSYTYDFAADVNYFGNYKFDLIGNELVEFGTFPVTKPTNYIEMK
ncbi:MAG: hypothetical protein ACOYN2_04480 [Patescibacteria group bacterium]